jgi:nucleoid DNA-binding protein
MKKNEVLRTTKAKAEVAGVKTTMKDLDVITTALYDTIVEALQKGDSVKFNEVTYSVVDVAERTGIVTLGDKKGETWVKPAHKEVKIKASKALKTIVE